MTAAHLLERIDVLEKALADTQKEVKELKEKNYILQHIFDNSKNSIFSLDTQYRYTSFNELHKKSMKDIYNADIKLGVSTLDYMDNEEDKAYSEKSLIRALSGEHLAEETVCGADDAKKQYFFITDTLIKNEQNQIIGVAFTATDITENKKAELKLKHTKELLERSNTAANIGTWEIDLETQKVIWSRVTRQIHEVDDDFEANVSNAILFYKEGENRTRVEYLVNHAIKYGSVWEEELQIITAKGNEKWVRAIILTEVKDGQCIRVYGTFQDIDDRKNKELRIKLQNEELSASEEELRVNLEELIKLQANLEIKQQALQISEERYRKIVETQTDFVLLSTPETTITFANETLAKVLETTPENMLGLKWIDFALPEDTKTIQNKIKALTPQKNTFSNENRYKRADSTWGWTQWLNQGIFDENNVLIQIQSLGRDITKLKETQLKLTAEQQRFQSIVDSTEGMVWEANFNTFQITYISQKAKRLLGYEIEEWYQPDFWINHIYPADKEFVINATTKFCKNLESYDLEYRFLTKENKVLWLKDIVNVCLDVEGNYVLRGIMVDISKDKQIEEQLYRLSLVAQNTSNIVIITDVNYAITWVNAAFTRITEYTFDEAIGKTHSLLRFEGTSAETIKQINEKLSQIEPIHCEILNRSKTGKMYWAEAEIQPLWDKNGLHTGFMAIKTDITARKKAKEELDHLIDITRSQNQRLSEYAYITSHNIRSSVANMMGLTALVREEPENTSYLDMLDTSVYQLDSTIRTMNDLLDMEIETQAIERKPIKLLQAVQNNISLIQNLANKVNIRLEIPEELTVFVIPVYLDSILNNLLTNAIKYRRLDVEPYIHLVAYQENNAIVLAVKDNGIGIDLKKNAHKLFKLKSRLTNKVEGKGIGLFFTKHQIEAMGGKIEVESELNEGTTFKVWFYQN